jgi:hypothetical protein
MATPTLTFRAPKELQETAKKKALKIGVPLSLVLQQALKTFVYSDSLTFTENGFTPEFENLVQEAEKESSDAVFFDIEEVIDYINKK